MKIQFTLIILLCSIVHNSVAQNTEVDYAAKANQLIIADSVHFGQKHQLVLADSFSVAENKLELYFASNSKFKKGDLVAEFVDVLPEILLPIMHTLPSTAQLHLLAKDAALNTWQSLEYFCNVAPRAVYKPVENNDPQFAVAGSSSPVISRVFPTIGSPTPAGVLAGKTVWLSPGHGWENSGSGFTTQRGTTNFIVEDFVTAESVDYFLMGYLFNAGANVWSVRERDVNTNEIIVDNDVASSGYSETGIWTTGAAPGYGGTYRVATADVSETATANFIPNVTQSGLYWVSVRCVAGVNRATAVNFKVIHSGDTSVVNVNQELHGETWVYLGQFYFTSGGLNKIIISNFSLEDGQAIIADAVRLGGGIGTTLDCSNTAQPASNRPRFEESARQYALYQGYPTCTGDVTIRPIYAEYEMQKGGLTEQNNSIYVSVHTNAGGGTGTETYRYNGLGSGQPNITPGSTELRGYIHNQVIADVRALWNPTWADRGVKQENFGELRPLATMPGILLELAFHDLAADATALRHPEFRRIAAKAIYKGIVRFFNNRDGIPLTFLPEQPTNAIAKNVGSNNIQVSWVAPVSGGAYGDAATGYKVYISTNGKSFKDGIAVTGNSFTFNGNPASIYYFKITATNAGGESFSSSIVAAKTPRLGSTNVPYLIVDGFDRLDGSALISRTESVTLGTVRRMFLERMNRYDYMIEHAQALGTCNNNIAFDGCQNEAVASGTVVLSNYTAVDWFTGEESTTDRSIDATESALIKTYLNAGGNLLISGSEIGWDIGRAASANYDADLYNNYLRATYVNDDANSYNFTGTSVLFNGQNGTFDNGTNGYYDVDFPDRVISNAGSTIALNYVGGTADGAAIGYQGAYRSLYLAFPFEAITSATVRNNLMCNAVAYLTPSLVLPVRGLDIAGKNINLHNYISFSTLSEINTKQFVVERSENGIMFSNNSNQILPKGNTNQGATYHYIDKNILPLGYYRIKVTDNDGSVSFSKILTIKQSSNDQLFTINNNPATSSIKIWLKNNSENQVTLINSAGQTVYRTRIANANIYEINAANFAKGMYTLVINCKGQQQAEKIIIQ
jgi:N-acetylmuramoyl-L-alanine amidase